MTAFVTGWLLAGAAAGGGGCALQRLRRTRRAVAHAEHELRGPLAAVLLAVELGLRDGGLGPGQLSVTRAELRRAERALEDLARARHGIGPMTAVTEVNVARVVKDSVEAWRPAAVANGVTLEFSGQTPGRPLLGDPVRLAQATGNLIANAIEHGGSRVTVTAGEAASGIRVAVTDDGPGLPESIVAGDRVTPTRALPPRGHRSEGGVRGRGPAGRGYGLAIVAGIAAAHGGRLRVVDDETPAGQSPSLASTGANAHRAGASLVLEFPAAPRA